MSKHEVTSALIALSLSGFHIGITLLALFRARKALLLAETEGRADRRTLWRLATLRFVAAVVILSGGLLAVCPPLAYVSGLSPGLLPTTPEAMMAIIVGAWFVWITATVGLDNLALRWLKLAGVARGRNVEQ